MVRYSFKNHGMIMVPVANHGCPRHDMHILCSQRVPGNRLGSDQSRNVPSTAASGEIAHATEMWVLIGK